MIIVDKETNDLISGLRLSLSKCQDFIKHQQSVINVKDDAITELNKALARSHEIGLKQNNTITLLQTECDRKDDVIALLKDVIEMLNL